MAVTVRILRVLAVAVNLGLFALGVWLQRTPRYPGDAWAAGAAAGMAVLNVAMLLLAGEQRVGPHFLGRLRRIVLTLNGLLLAAALLFGAASVAERPTALELAASAALLVVPALTLAAVVLSPRRGTV